MNHTQTQAEPARGVNSSWSEGPGITRRGQKVPVPARGCQPLEPAGESGGTLLGRPNAVFTTALDQLAFLLEKGCSASPGNGGYPCSCSRNTHIPFPSPSLPPLQLRAGSGKGHRDAPGSAGMLREAPGRGGMRRDAVCLSARPLALPAKAAGQEPAWGVTALFLPVFLRAPASKGGWISQPNPPAPAFCGVPGHTGEPREGFAFIPLAFLAGQ